MTDSWPDGSKRLSTRPQVGTLQGGILCVAVRPSWLNTLARFAFQGCSFNNGSGSGDRCVFSHLRSTILSAHYGDDVRQQAFGELARRLH